MNCCEKKLNCGTDSFLGYFDADKMRAEQRTVEAWIKSGSWEVNEDSIWDLDQGSLSRVWGSQKL